jgi:nicotinate-nucleotide adenylyltransferase
LKIGIFGGTFNPIHYGHLINAQLLLEDFSLDRILFVPSKKPVHKEIEENISGEDRYCMIQYAIEGNNGFEVSRIELDREDPSYTIITIRDLQQNSPDDAFYLIIGMDSLNDFHTWKEYRAILKRVPLIIIERPYHQLKNESIIDDVDEIYFANNPLIDISSSRIRDYVKQGRSIQYLVTPKVEQYISERGLFQQ